jgi:hypothetical protein
VDHSYFKVSQCPGENNAHYGYSEYGAVYTEQIRDPNFVTRISESLNVNNEERVEWAGPEIGRTNCESRDLVSGRWIAGIVGMVEC